MVAADVPKKEDAYLLLPDRTSCTIRENPGEQVSLNETAIEGDTSWCWITYTEGKKRTLAECVKTDLLERQEVY